VQGPVERVVQVNCGTSRASLRGQSPKIFTSEFWYSTGTVWPSTSVMPRTDGRSHIDTVVIGLPLAGMARTAPPTPVWLPAAQATQAAELVHLETLPGDGHESFAGVARIGIDRVNDGAAARPAGPGQDVDPSHRIVHIHRTAGAGADVHDADLGTFAVERLE